MKVLIQLKDEDGKMFFLKKYERDSRVGWGYILHWSDVKKEAFDFKHLDNDDFNKLLEAFAEHHHTINITFVTRKK